MIPIAEWRRIEALLEDIRYLDVALAKPDRRMIPFEVTSAILDGRARSAPGASTGALARATLRRLPVSA